MLTDFTHYSQNYAYFDAHGITDSCIIIQCIMLIKYFLTLIYKIFTKEQNIIDCGFNFELIDVSFATELEFCRIIMYFGKNWLYTVFHNFHLSRFSQHLIILKIMLAYCMASPLPSTIAIQLQVTYLYVRHLICCQQTQ